METNDDLIGLRVRINLADDQYDGEIGVIAGVATDEYYSVRVIGREDLHMYTEDELKVASK